MAKKDDLRLSSIIKIGSSSVIRQNSNQQMAKVDIVILGCPFDQIRRRTIHKEGQQLGPCCLRRFFPKVGPVYNSEYQIDIGTGINIQDWGNVEMNDGNGNQDSESKSLESRENAFTKVKKAQQIIPAKKNLLTQHKPTYQTAQKDKYKPNIPTPVNKYSAEQVIQRIRQEIEKIYKTSQKSSSPIPFILGGSKQCSLGSAKAFRSRYPQNGVHVLISGLPFMKRPYDNDKLTSDNLLTILCKEYQDQSQKLAQNKGRVILFGPDQKYILKGSNKNNTQDQQKNLHGLSNFKPTLKRYISYKQIYEDKTFNSQTEQRTLKRLGYSTKPAAKLKNTLDSDTPYHITLSVEAIQGFSGCRDLLAQGIKPEEMMQIFYLLGSKENVKGIDITEFNPSCEDYQSSLILVNLLYYFIMGYRSRKG